MPHWIRPRCVEYAPSGPNDYPDLLQVIREACAGLEDFVILGWSFSGPPALMAAAESPPGLRGVVICASFVRSVFRRVTPSAFAARSRAALGVDARAAGAQRRVPVLYLAASHDVVVPRWNAKAVVAAVPRAEVVTVRGPHLALRTNAPAGVAAVTRFIAGLGST